MNPGAELDWARRRILVIEDDPETLERIRAAFATVGLGGLEVMRDGGDVVNVLRRFAADLVLMEANPAGTDGLEVLRAIRGRDSPNRDVIVAVMVAMADAERLRRMCGIGIESFIRKPVSADVLLARVAGAILNPRRFISSLTYFGPDRRKPRAAGDPYLGPEKRRVVKSKDEPRRPVEPLSTKAVPPPRKPVLGDNIPLVDDAPPKPAKPILSDNIPLVDAPAPKPQKPGETIEVIAKAPPRTSGGEDWSTELAPKKKREEEAGFDVAGMVSGHAEWLQSNGAGGTKAMVEGQDLSGAQMPGVNLSGATLRNVRLTGANLRAAVLQSVDLRGSDLSGADLTEGDLTSSNLRRADVSTAKLDRAKLAGTDLAGASLRGASLEGADLRGANLLDADIASTDLSLTTGLVQAQINKSRPNQHTMLPPGLRRPAIE